MDHPREIVIVRHGETPYNIAKRTADRYFESAEEVERAGNLSDHQVPLNDAGRKQAQAVGASLARLGEFDTYFDSGYRRSIETLDIILEAFSESERHPAKRRSHLDLREREPGYTFNMKDEDVKLYFPWYNEHRTKRGMFYTVPPGGESLAQVCSRVHMFLISLRRARAGEKVLISTHGRVMLCFRFWLEKWAASKTDELFCDKDFGNCEVLHYVYNLTRRAYDTRPFDA
jgi:broad specificity phosphatase PhoE